ncbi:MAG: VWA-like domain-containing protein [Pseudomonadota bacterium]
MAGRAKAGKYTENRKAITDGSRLADRHPLIQPLPDFNLSFEGAALEMGPQEWLRVDIDRPADRWSPAGVEPEVAVMVRPNLRLREAPEHWAYVFARLRLHVVLGHFEPMRDALIWHLAAWYEAEEILSVSSVGRRPPRFPPLPTGLPRGGAAAVARYLDDVGEASELAALSLSAPGRRYWSVIGRFEVSEALTAQRTANLATGIRAAAAEAIDVAGGARGALGQGRTAETILRRALAWAISSFPLLASLAASFRLIEDADLCQQMGVEVAAISDATQEIYANPRIGFTEAEARFVMAHELLHAGLRHTQRRQGRDPWFWNVACDFVINDWLLEMQVGHPPERIGYLHDIALRGLSAEQVYDRIVSDLRLMRKLRKARTLNGAAPDMIEREPAGWWNGGGVDLDAFYRRALSEGLEMHLGRGRGLLPTGLVEEIRALSQPPIPWDVELAQWLDQFFPPLEARRTFARAHRRQSATPDIPRPAWVRPDEARSARVFGVVLDTSGSMTRLDLGKAIGAIASYAMSREVGYVRLIQCDAAPHDAGYVEPESLLDRVRLTGRGGTVLMPGVRLLEEAPDFPPDGPILLITDGGCDRLVIRRDHAFLLSGGHRLPFTPRGPVFRVA